MLNGICLYTINESKKITPKEINDLIKTIEEISHKYSDEELKIKMIMKYKQICEFLDKITSDKVKTTPENKTKLEEFKLSIEEYINDIVRFLQNIDDQKYFSKDVTSRKKLNDYKKYFFDDTNSSRLKTNFLYDTTNTTVSNTIQERQALLNRIKEFVAEKEE